MDSKIQQPHEILEIMFGHPVLLRGHKLFVIPIESFHEGSIFTHGILIISVIGALDPLQDGQSGQLYFLQIISMVLVISHTPQNTLYASASHPDRALPVPLDEIIRRFSAFFSSAAFVKLKDPVIILILSMTMILL